MEPGRTERNLNGREQGLLDFERDWRAHEGGKAEAVRRRFGFSPSRYSQLLALLLDDPAALAYDPLTVRRLRRRREERGGQTTLRQRRRAPSR